MASGAEGGTEGGQEKRPPRAATFEALCRAEREFLESLRHRPDDTGVRLELAWCLGMQALFAAGREYATGEGGLLAQDACGLLLRCLREAAIVSHLSANPTEQGRVAELYALVQMSSNERALREAGEEACRLLERLTEAISAAPLVARPMSRSRRRRA